MQEEDKEYLKKLNVDYHSNKVVIKTIQKDFGKHSTKSSGDNLDKSFEFIFYDGEEKIETKKLRYEELCES